MNGFGLGTDAVPSPFPMDQFGALFEYPWTIHEKGGPCQSDGPMSVVEGQWAEDGCPFKVTMPFQLAPIFVKLMNTLHEKKEVIRRKRDELAKLERDFNAIVK